MTRLLLVASILIVSAHAAPFLNSLDQMKKDMIATGVSEETADEIMNMGKRYMRDHMSELTNFNKESLMQMAVGLNSEWEDYLKTRSEADQKAFETYSINSAAENMQSYMDLMGTKN